MKKNRNSYTLYKTNGSWYPKPNGNVCIHVIAYSIKQAIYMANEDLFFNGQTGIFEVEGLNNLKSEWTRFDGEIATNPVFSSDNERLSKEEEDYLAMVWDGFVQPFEVQRKAKSPAKS